jgi:ATP-binding cassette subfamily B protein
LAKNLAQRGILPFRQVLAFTMAQWRRQPASVAVVVVSAAGWTASDIMMPVYAGHLIDAVAAAGHDRAAALHAAIVALAVMVALGLGLVACRFVTFWGIVRLTLANMGDVARATFARVQRFSTEWHANNFAGSTVRKISRGMWAFDQLNDTLLLALLPSAMVLAGSTLLLGLRWPAMGAVVGLGSVLFICQSVALSLLFVSPAALLSNRWDTRLGGALADAVSCGPVVKAFGAEAREDARLAAVVTKWQRRTQRFWMRGTVSGTTQATSLLVLRAAVVSLVLWLWWRGAASPGDVTWVLTTYFVIHGYLRDVGQNISVLQRSVNDMHEMVLMHGQAYGVPDAPHAPPIRIERGEIAFDRIGFAYAGGSKKLYDDFSVRIEAGERVGLVGHSGSGKTTFVKLLARLYDADSGQIRIDGQDIARVAQSSLRAQIATVQQDPVLFHRSLAENIGYGRPGASQAAIEHAAMLANAHDFIARLPKGYGTLVGERGVKLSGGERQRVALARAFLADTRILILDEATSSLDSESEALIQEAMLRLLAGRTAIVIAHRLSTVRALDRILVFDKGHIVEEGTHDSLQARNGIYRRLVDMQAAGLSDAVGPIRN